MCIRRTCGTACPQQDACPQGNPQGTWAGQEAGSDIALALSRSAVKLRHVPGKASLGCCSCAHLQSCTCAHKPNGSVHGAAHTLCGAAGRHVSAPSLAHFGWLCCQRKAEGLSVWGWVGLQLSVAAWPAEPPLNVPPLCWAGPPPHPPDRATHVAQTAQQAQ